VILCDTNILIQFFKNDVIIIQRHKEIGIADIAISVITEAELYAGALNKAELNKIKRNLSYLHKLELNENISKRFINLLIEYNLSHRLDIPDSIIAATAIENKMPLFTLNKKDFKFIDTLELFE